jgi:hypothetical protein
MPCREKPRDGGRGISGQQARKRRLQIGRFLIDLAGVWMASVAEGLLFAHVGDCSFWVRCLDLERSNERVLALDRHLTSCS